MRRSDYYTMVATCPNAQVVKAASAYGGSRDLALDLGAGNLRDTKYLLSTGFKSVVAVDQVPIPTTPQVEAVQEKLERYMPMPNTFDFAVCCNVLFFIKKEDAAKVIARAYNALTQHGLLVFNLLNVSDEWVVKNQHDAVGYSQDEIARLLSCFGCKTVDRSAGYFPREGRVPKYWDIWKVSVQKS